MPVTSTIPARTDIVVLRSTLDRLASQVAGLPVVRQSDVHAGDMVIVSTKNSIYALRVNGDGTFDVRGGWFSRNPESGERLRIAGCTWGGTALLTGVVAAPGMFLEFSNRVTTTRIREVRHLRANVSPTVH